MFGTATLKIFTLLKMSWLYPLKKEVTDLSA